MTDRPAISTEHKPKASAGDPSDILDRQESGTSKDTRTPLDQPGVSGGTAGTGGENRMQDR